MLVSEMWDIDVPAGETVLSCSSGQVVVWIFVGGLPFSVLFV